MHINKSISKSMVVRVAPFIFYIIVMILSGVLADMRMDVRWIYAIRAGGAALILLLLRNQYAELTWPPRISLHTFMFSVLIGVLVFILWINFDRQWMVVGKAVGYDPRMADGGLNYPMIVMRMAGAVLVVPLMEELFWRSFLMRWIDRMDFLSVSPAKVSITAILISSLLFASEHTFWFSGLIAGLAYAWLYRKTQNLWASIIAHAVTNCLLGIWVMYTGRWDYW